MKEFLYSKWIQQIVVILHLVALTALVADYGFILSTTLKSGIIYLYFFVFDYWYFLYRIKILLS